MAVAFTASRRFDPSVGKEWLDYIAWSGLDHLKEVVSLDEILCPGIIRDLIDGDWQYNVQENFQTHRFHDLAYLMGRTAGEERRQILAVVKNPTPSECNQLVDRRFVFRGFDLIEVGGGISALLNCGGFDKAFLSSDLSDCGLVTEHLMATEIQRRLREEYPDEHHAECDSWAIWQMKEV